MPAAANIVLTDQQAANWTYEVVGITPDFKLLNRASTTSAGSKSINVSFSPRSSQRPTNRVRVKFSFPVEQTVDGQTVVAHTSIFEGSWTLHEALTAQQLLNFGSELRDLLGESLIKAYYETLTPAY